MKYPVLISILAFCLTQLLGQSSQGNLEYKSEDSYCFKLKERENPNALDIESELKRFREELINKLTDKEVFRIVTQGGTPGDVSQFQIIKFERIDSLCSITLKFVDNAKRKEVFVITKTYGLSSWQKFNSLADTTFWNQPRELPAKKYIMDGATKIYEFNSLGKYHVLHRGSNSESTDNTIIEEHLWKLLKPIFGINCRETMR